MLMPCEGTVSKGTLRYLRQTYSLNTHPRPGEGVTSLLVNDINLEVADDGRVLYVWGLCPHTEWLDACLVVPTASPTPLRWHGPDLVPGVGVRLNKGERWSVHADRGAGWLVVGNSQVSATDEVFYFAPGAMLVMRHGKLVGLWLHPEGAIG